MIKKANDQCHVCGKGQMLNSTHTRTFEPNGKKVKVKLLNMTCNSCGETTTKAWQHTANLKTLAARKEHYGSALMCEEIIALRCKHKLSLLQAAELFGVSELDFFQFESEYSYPNASTNLLLSMAIEHELVIDWLIGLTGLELPTDREDPEVFTTYVS